VLTAFPWRVARARIPADDAILGHGVVELLRPGARSQLLIEDQVERLGLGLAAEVGHRGGRSPEGKGQLDRRARLDEITLRRILPQDRSVRLVSGGCLERRPRELEVDLVGLDQGLLVRQPDEVRDLDLVDRWRRATGEQADDEEDGDPEDRQGEQARDP
jgi:hypothetical protein